MAATPAGEPRVGAAESPAAAAAVLLSNVLLVILVEFPLFCGVIVVYKCKIVLKDKTPSQSFSLLINSQRADNGRFFSDFFW